MNGHQQAIRLPDIALGNYAIPLLDDEFDADRDELIEQSDIFAMHASPHLQDETDEGLEDINIDKF